MKRSDPISHRLYLDSFASKKGTGIWAERIRLDKSEFPHDHDCIEIQVVVDGRAIHQSTLGEHKVKKGDIIILRPGAWHAYQTVSAVTAWVCCFKLDRLQDELAWIMNDPRISALLWHGPVRQGEAGTYMIKIKNKLLQEIENSMQSLHRAIQNDQYSSMIGWLLVTLNQLASALPKDMIADFPRDDAVRKAMMVLESDLAKPWSVEDLSKIVDLSEGHLSRRFTQATGYPPISYLTRLRLERSAVLLIRTDYSARKIGSIVGWDNPSYFARRFKDYFGVTAGEYRTLASHASK